jgi:hypothetical protein
VIENEIGGSTKSRLAIFFALQLLIALIAALPFVWRKFVYTRCAYPASSDCINNLRQIDAAKQQWALEKRKETNDIPSMMDIAQYIHGGVPKCRGGGVYTLGPVADSPRCSITGHVLP